MYFSFDAGFFYCGAKHFIICCPNAFYLVANNPSCSNSFVAWKEKLDKKLVIFFNDKE
jgi:hypothetical protein